VGGLDKRPNTTSWCIL